jgi:hypothetical protein
MPLYLEDRAQHCDSHVAAIGHQTLCLSRHQDEKSKQRSGHKADEAAFVAYSLLKISSLASFFYAAMTMALSSSKNHQRSPKPD